MLPAVARAHRAAFCSLATTVNSGRTSSSGLSSYSVTRHASTAVSRKKSNARRARATLAPTGRKATGLASETANAATPASSTARVMPALSRESWRRAHTASLKATQSLHLLRPPHVLRKTVSKLLEAPFESEQEGAYRLVVAELMANPSLEGRMELANATAAHVPQSPSLRNLHPPVFASHLDGIVALSSLSTIDERKELLGAIVRMRYNDAPFMSFADLLRALPCFKGEAAEAAVDIWLRALPLNVVRTQAKWEGADFEATRVRAVKDLRALEREVQLKSACDTAHVRSRLLQAYAVLREPEDARHQFAWFRRVHSVKVGIFDDALRAAPSLESVELVMKKTKSIRPNMKGEQKAALAAHYARLGFLDRAMKLKVRFGVDRPWFFHALKNTTPESRKIQRQVKFYKALTAAGLDFPAVEWIISRFKNIYGRNQDEALAPLLQ